MANVEVPRKIPEPVDPKDLDEPFDADSSRTPEIPLADDFEEDDDD